MRRSVIAAGSLLLLSGCSLADLAGRSASSSHAGRRLRSEVPSTPLQFDIADGFERLNRVRRARLLSPFRRDNRLQLAAQRHADHMGATGLYGHEIGPGTDFVTRINAAGFDNSSGENLGVGYGSVDEAIQGWMDSPPHRKNMLKGEYTIAGLAYAFNQSGRNPRFTHFWVLIMGKDDGRVS